MSDLDIVIKLDPTQPVAGAKTVTDALAKTEAQGKKTETALDKNFKQLTQSLKEGFKGQMMMAIREGIAGIAKELEAATGFGTKFAQMGGMFGPWGAAIGLAVDGAKALTDALFGMSEAEERAAAEAKAFNDAIDLQESTIGRLVAETYKLADAYDRLAKNKPLTDQVDFYQGLAKTTNDYRDALRLLNDNVDINANFVQRRLDLSQGLRTAMLAESLAAKGYGQATIEAAVAAQQNLDKSVELARAHATGALTAGTDAAAQKRLAEEYKRAAEEAERYRRAIFDARAPGGYFTGSNAEAFRVHQTESERLLRQIEAEEGAAPKGPDWNAMKERSAAASKAVAEMQEDAWRRTIEATDKWNKELFKTTDSLAEINEIGATAFSSIQEQMELLVTSGKVSFSDLIDSMIADLGRLAAQRAALGLIGLLGSLGSSTSYADGLWGGAQPGGAFGYAATGKLPGFASGGTIFPSGSGTQDTQTVMFRKAPSETVRIQTPQQEMAYRRGGPEGGGGASTVRVVNEADPRALYSDRDLVVGIAKNRDMIKRLIG